MNGNREKLSCWLKTLFYIQLAGTLLSAVAVLATVVPFPVGDWYTWVQRAVSLGVAVCLYLLHGRYRYAGMVKALGLLCSLVSLVLFQVLHAYGVQLDGISYGRTLAWLSRITSVLNLTALCLEYTAHAQIVPKESGKWYLFLGCTLGSLLLSSVAMGLLQPMLEKMVQEGVFWPVNLWNLFSYSLSLGLGVIYLVLLRRMIRIHEAV